MSDAGREEDEESQDLEFVCHACRRRWMEPAEFAISGEGCPSCGAGPHLITGWDQSADFRHRPRLRTGLTHLSPRVLDRMRLQGIAPPRSAAADRTENRAQPGQCLCGGWIATAAEGTAWRQRLRRAERHDLLYCPF